MKELFLISSSKYQGGGFWDHCFGPLMVFMGEPEEGRNKILFIPFANADRNFDSYTEVVSERFSQIGYEVVGMHTYEDQISCFNDDTICAVCVGGGNTWLLANSFILDYTLLTIHYKVSSGKWKYIGASAGTIMACDSIITTNDKCPLQVIKNTQGFGLIPFQINPHFVPGAMIDKYMGEPREEQLRQVILYNQDWQIVGLPEGCWIVGSGDEYILRGTGEAVIFRKDNNNSIWLPCESFDKMLGGV